MFILFVIIHARLGRTDTRTDGRTDGRTDEQNYDSKTALA